METTQSTSKTGIALVQAGHNVTEEVDQVVY